MRLPDYHVHTSLCKHARGLPEAYAAEASSKGISEICFADHCPNPDGFDPAHRMDMEQFPLYRAQVEGLGKKRGVEFLLGVEADYYEGCEGFLESWLPEQGLDLVLGSVHFIHGWGFDDPAQQYIWEQADLVSVWRSYFDLVGKMVDSGLFDVVAHLDLPKKFGHRPPDKELREMAAPILDRIARKGMGLEVNTSGLRRPVKEIYPSPMLLSMAGERDIPICFGSDAHRPEEIGAGFDEALERAREAGYTTFFRMARRARRLCPLPLEEKGAPGQTLVP